MIAANPNNIALINQQYRAQLVLVSYLLSMGYISPATVLAGSAPAYIGGDGTGAGAAG